MKKRLSLILVLVLCLSLCACGKDYSKHQFTFFDNGFNWDMTEEEVCEYISENQLIANEIEISRYDSWTVIKDDMYVFSFDENGKIEYVKYDMGYAPNMVNTLNEWYGTYDEYESEFDQFIWYGTMAGRNVKMTFYTVSQCWLEFSLE